MNNFLISIVVPVYNEQEVIPLFYKEITRSLEDFNYEILFVNDGSTDQSRKTIQNLSDNKVREIRLARNFGQQIAILVGLSEAKGDAVCIIDADLQDPPRIIPRLVAEWQNGSKVVFAKRKTRQDPCYKVFLANTFYLFLNLFSKKRIDQNIGDFYLLDKEICKQLTNDELIHFIRARLQKLDVKKSYIYFDRKNRQAGRSKYRMAKMFKLALLSFQKAKPLNLNEAIFRAKNIAIIGAGISGLGLGYYLSKIGHKVTLYEKEDQPGGLLKTVETTDKHDIEQLYHHFFKTDKFLIELLRELGLEKQIEWQRSQVSIYKNNLFYKFDNLTNILKLPIISLLQKLNLIFGSAILVLLPTYIWQKSTAKKVISLLMSSVVWEKIWQPLFQGKFGDKANNIKATWFVSRLKCRFFSRDKGSEMLGYLKDSFSILVERLSNEIMANQGRIIYEEVKQVDEKKNLVIVNEQRYDLAISTIAEPALSKILNKKVDKINYLGVICALIELKGKKTDYYWTNILDNRIPFKCLIEHTNLIKRKYKNTLIYLGQYLENTSAFYNQTEAEIRDYYIKELTQIVGLEAGEIISFKLFKYPYAQPIIDSSYQQMSHKITEKILSTSMAHIYPEDRGLNYAIRECKGIVDLISEL